MTKRKTWNPLFFTYVNVLLLNAHTTKTGFPKQPLTVPFRHFLVCIKYLTEEVENEQGEPVFLPQCHEEGCYQEKKETLAARARKYQAKALLGDETEGF